MALLLSIFGIAVAAIILFLIVFRIARAQARRAATAQFRDLLAAGAWALAKAGLNPPTSPVAESPDITAKLDLWFEGLRELYAKQARDQDVASDLSLAKDFQRAYLERPYPKVPAVHVAGRLRLKFHHLYVPAMALGGDFFDIQSDGLSTGGVFIADVMGHGTRAALITAILRTLINDLARQCRNARFFMTEMNKQFYALLKSMPEPLFVSAFYFVADTTARVATFSSAGHPSPFLLHRHTARIARLDVPPPRGAALGIIPNEEYTCGQFRLTDGDVFIFFTDGAYEVHNSAGDEFGIARMEKVLHANIYRTPEEIVQAIMKALSDFAGDEPFADDICLVAVEVTTKAEEADAKN